MNKSEQDLLLDELEKDVIEVSTSTEEQIVRKYDEGQAQIIIQRNDFLIPNIIKLLEDKYVLNISPKYQRRKRWNDIKRSLLIESLLMNIPIPPIFLYEHELAKYEVMDGQQRLETIRSFFNNEFELKSLENWPELDGRKYSDLPRRIQAALQRRGLGAIIILSESGEGVEDGFKIRQYVFERLNTGGEKLNPQEIRNCIYASYFNDAIVELSRSELFTKAWGIPVQEPDEPHKISKLLQANKLYSTMADCQIVLRYFALSDTKQFRGGMKRALDECMERGKQLSKERCNELIKEYATVLALAHNIYGDSLFRLPNKKGELGGRKSIPLADAVMVALMKNLDIAKMLIRSKDIILRGTLEYLTESSKYQSLVGKGNTKKEIEERIGLMDQLFKSSIL